MMIWLLLVVVIGVLAYIRWAPSDPKRWHIAVDAHEDKSRPGGVVRIIDGDMKSLAQLSEIALDSPRTILLAGSVENAMMTFVSRSLWFGFPDYTTVQLTDGKLKMHARLRFGRSDLGVNAARLQRWISKLDR